MALGPRDLHQIAIQVIAEDQASGPLNRIAGEFGRLQKSFRLFGFGIAATQIGQGLESIGRKTLSLVGSVVKMRTDFDYQMRLVQTQAQLTGKQYNKMVNDAIRISGKFPQGADQIAQGLYDIFSSTDVNFHRALNMVQSFAKAATAGGTDIRTVSRGAIAEMNAFELPASSITHILDLQFQMVRKGVGTYDEFVSAIGNVLPAARTMNQTLAQVSGAVAFMSRNGFTAAQSSISVARALDQLTRSSNAKKLKDTLGVDIVDHATGQYKSLTEIMTEMHDKLAGMTQPQVQKALFNVFGAGEIRANRFFRLAIPNLDRLKDMVKSMGGSGVAGQLNKAFGIVQKSPVVQLQELLNHLRAIGMTVAKMVIPSLRRGLEFLAKFVDWLDKLSPGTKRFVLQAVILGGVISLVAGKVLVAVGAFARLASILEFTGIAKAGSLAIFGIVGAIAALIIGGYLLIKNWDKVKDWWNKNWHIIKEVAIAAAAIIGPLLAIKLVLAIKTFVFAIQYYSVLALDAIKGFFAKMIELAATNPWAAAITAIIFLVVMIVTHWGKIKRFLLAVWDVIKKYAMIVWTAISNFFKKVGGWIYDHIVTPAIALWKQVVRIWNVVKAATLKVWDDVVHAVEVAGKFIYDYIVHPILEADKIIFNVFKSIYLFIFNTMKSIYNDIKPALELIYNIIKLVLTAIWTVVKMIWKAITVVFQVAFKIITDIITIAVKLWYNFGKVWLTLLWDMIKTGFQILVKVLQGLWNLLKILWHALWAVIKFLWEQVGKRVIDFIRTYIKLWVNYIKLLWNILKEVWHVLWVAITAVWNTVGKPIWHIIQTVVKGAWDIIKGIWDAAVSAWHGLWAAFDFAWKHVGKPIFDAITAFIHGVAKIWSTVWDGIKAGFLALWTGIKTAIAAVINPIIFVIEKFVNLFIHALNFVRNIFGLSDVSTLHIPRLARGTRDWKGGLATVGEEGPELVYLPEGSAVLPAGKTKRVLRQINAEGYDPREVPGFAAGMNPTLMGRKVYDQLQRGGGFDPVGSFMGFLGGIPGDAWKAIGTATKAIVDKALDLFGVTIPKLPGQLTEIGPKIFTQFTEMLYKAAVKWMGNVTTWATSLMNSSVITPEAGVKDFGSLFLTGGPRVGSLTPAASAIYHFGMNVPGIVSGSTGKSIRNIIGTSTWSQHAYGNAVDFFSRSQSPDAPKQNLANAIAAAWKILHIHYMAYNNNGFEGGTWGHGVTSSHTNHVHADPYPQYAGDPRTDGHPVPGGFAKGGRVTRRGLYQLAEHGPEWIIPEAIFKAAFGRGADAPKQSLAALQTFVQSIKILAGKIGQVGNDLRKALGGNTATLLHAAGRVIAQGGNVIKSLLDKLGKRADAINKSIDDQFKKRETDLTDKFEKSRTDITRKYEALRAKAKTDAQKRQVTAQEDADKRALSKQEEAAKRALDKAKDQAEKHADVMINALTRLADRIEARRASLADHISALQSQMKNFRDAVVQGFSQTNLVQQFGNNPFVVPAQIRQYYRDQISSAKRFAGLLRRLAKAGLNRAMLQQLASAGPSAIPLAQAILQTGVGQVNRYQAAINRIAGTTATGLTNVEFRPEIRKLRNQVGDFNSSLKKLIDRINERLKQITPVGDGHPRHPGGGNQTNVTNFNMNVTTKASASEIRQEIGWWWRHHGR